MIQYPTIVLDEHEMALAEKKAQELVNFFLPRIKSRGKSGSSIQNLEERIKG